MNTVLFVSWYNSSWSIMAEAFTNALSDGRYVAESAGFEPGSVDPLVVQAMLEVGLDVRGHVASSVFDMFKAGRVFSHVITVCDADTDAMCPMFRGVSRRANWPYPHTAQAVGDRERKLRKVRAIRDDIKRRVENFLLESM